MPTPSSILLGLSRIANEWWLAAVAWHLVLAALVLAPRIGGWRPNARLAAAGLAAPLASVSVLAWLAHNPFNGLMFALATALVLLFGLRAPQGAMPYAPRWAVVLGSASLAFAWAYPHFLVGRPAYFYLFAAPVGLVPCPTLSAVLGLGLIAGGFRSRSWSVTAGVFGLFYALFGMLRLHVWLDVGLLVSAVAMLVRAATLGRTSEREQITPGVPRMSAVH